MMAAWLVCWLPVSQLQVSLLAILNMIRHILPTFLPEERYLIIAKINWGAGFEPNDYLKVFQEGNLAT